MRRSSGLSLVEVMVASALLLLLTGMLLIVMRSSRLRLQRFEALIHLEEQAVKTMAQLGSDLSEAHLNTVESIGPNFLVFSSARDTSGQLIVAPSGELRWSSVICYREESINGEAKLLRQIEDIPDSDGESPHPNDLVPIANLGFFTSGTGPRSKIADGFESLSVTVEEDTRFEVILHLSADLGNSTHGIRLTSQVFPRN